MNVSVVITCHDEERTIEQAVRSVEAQTAFDRVVEIIVVNDGSRGWVGGRAGAAGRRNRRSSGSSRRRGSGRPPHAIAAVREARGEFIAFLDGDDFWTPEKLERQLPAFATQRNGSASFTAISSISAVMTRADGRVITVRRFDPDKPTPAYATTSSMTGRSCRPRSSFAAPFSTMSASSTSPSASARTPNSVCGSPRSGGFATSGRLHLQASACRPAVCEARRLICPTLPRDAAVCLTSSRAQVPRRPPDGAGSREGKHRLCDEGRTAQEPLRHDRHGHSSRAALLARLGQPGSAARASLGRAARLRGAQEAMARPAAVVALRLRGIRMRILYVVNGFDHGGAEHGLLTLVENGAFEGHDLRVLAFCRGRGDLADHDRRAGSGRGFDSSRTATR